MKHGRITPQPLLSAVVCLLTAFAAKQAMAETPVRSSDPYRIAQAQTSASESSTPPAAAPTPSATPASPPAPAAPASPPVPAPPPAAAAPAPAPAAASTKPDSTPKPDKSAESDGIPAVVIDGQQVESILGKKVRSNSGEDMGRIIDVIVDKSGQIRAAIIDFGGFLGVGTRQIAVDWRTIRFPSDQKSESLAVDLTRDQLRVAPVYKAGEQIVVLGRPRAEPAATAPQASAAPPPVAAKEAAPAPVAKDPNPAPSPTPTAAPAPAAPAPLPAPAAKDPATPQ